jgi:16S rRNA (guanine527-N7)-methyltransferase
VENPPPGSQDAFGAGWPLVRRYADMLATTAIERGLLGPREASRLWTRHLLQGAVIAPLVPEGTIVLDVGSGAGLPGLPLALAREDLRVILLDAAARRVAFLEEVVQELGLGARVDVRRSRLEELPPSERFPVLTARAVAPVPRLLSWCRPRLDRGGRLLALVGTAAVEEIPAGATVHRCGVGVLEEPVTVLEVREW